MLNAHAQLLIINYLIVILICFAKIQNNCELRIMNCKLFYFRKSNT
jgi:hypothetical protein